MAAQRFRYALEPVLSQRQWTLDELQGDLAERNALLAQQRSACAGVREQAEQAEQEWKVLGAGRQTVSVDRFMVVSRYLADRHAQLRQLEQQATRLEQERDAVLEQLVAARRALDAVEEHRERMRAAFMAARLSGEFKVADDQWSVLQAGMEKNGN